MGGGGGGGDRHSDKSVGTDRQWGREMGEGGDRQQTVEKRDE